MNLPKPGFPELLPSLDATSVAIYKYALEAGGLTVGSVAGLTGTDPAEAEAVLSGLIAMRLLQPNRDGWVPTHPATALATLLAPVEIDIRLRELDVARVREEVAALLPLYEEHSAARESPTTTIEILDNLESVRSALDAASAQCREETLTAQPGGGRQQEMLAEATPRALAMLQRGLRMRTIYQHTAVFSGPTRDYVNEVTRKGSEVRIFGEDFTRMIIFDRQVAFIGDRTRPNLALVIREPTLVGVLADDFERLWRWSNPFLAVPQRITRDAAEGMSSAKRTVLRLMADGLKDEVIARCLGMSVRTCRKHIAEIMQELNATSRFQAGCRAMQRGLIDSGPLSVTPDGYLLPDGGDPSADSRPESAGERNRGHAENAFGAARVRV
ncbi:LuxR C-terminal-related transcriptional regulator [Kitasatospora sp. NPDC017646]|uniref:helix-turn-helix transcriptional regulator n=1 Tax=Kitasatospora sp. NPDC017646 TaxID=3364024 RepID=UPI0037899EA4